MSDAAPTRPTVTAAIMVAVMMSLLGAAVAGEKSGSGEDMAWMAPLRQQYGWDTSELKNKVQQGDVTTYELGTPNYQILNPEDEPEYITADQPHYQEMLQRLTSSSNNSHTIDMSMPGTISSRPATGSDDVKPDKWEKLQKRSSNQSAEKITSTGEVEAVPLNEISAHPKVQIYSGAKPFQSRIANLS